jgi:hypothetical protein
MVRRNPFSCVTYSNYDDDDDDDDDDNNIYIIINRLCGLVVRVPSYRSRGPGSIPGATRFSEK